MVNLLHIGTNIFLANNISLSSCIIYSSNFVTILEIIQQAVYAIMLFTQVSCGILIYPTCARKLVLANLFSTYDEVKVRGFGVSSCKVDGERTFSHMDLLCFMDLRVC